MRRILRHPEHECKQLLAYTAVFHNPVSEGDLAKTHDLEVAFDEALRQVERSLAGGLETNDGDSARSQLEKLERELRRERDHALIRGHVDREWFTQTVRWVTEWVPETEITLIAALGRIARANTPSV
jgi:hypothetical protein